jgi:aminopeptidase Y
MVRKHRYVDKSINCSIHFYLGSGTVANLVLALNLARLFQTSSSSYSTYQYRVRFCWWGAEELGLIGSLYHLAQASLPNTTVLGERVQDYLVNLNCDMVASPNYIFGILNVLTAPVTTPSQALNGTGRMSDLFRQWFNEQKLPWSNTTISGSDLLSFLAAGIPVGDVHTGTATLKSADERDRYSAMLGTGNGGIANAGYDPCYHRQCDRITNINPFAFEKVAKSVAYAIEYLGRLNHLEKWLYPQGRSTNFAVLNKNQLYNFQNDPDII